VFFDPTAGGTRTGTLTITDNAAGSSQTVALTGSGEDFSVAPGAAASATVSAGQTASYSIAVAPAGGFAQSVALSCSGGPAGSACAVSPSTMALSGAAAQTAMVTVTTATHGWLLPFRGGWPRETRYRQTPMILTLAAMFLLMVVASQFLRQEQNLVWIRVAWFAALVTLGLTLTSCGGGSGSGGGGTNPQAGTYTVTVTGNFTSGSTTLTHAAKLTLVVQ
jgi:large repetitive protein